MSAMFITHAEELEVGVVVLPRLLDHLERAVDALQREVLRLGGDQRPVGGDEPVDRSAGRAPAGSRSGSRRRLLRASLSAFLSTTSRPILPAQRALDLGQDRRRGDDPVVDRVLGLRVARRARRRSSARRRAGRRSSPTGCPAGRGRWPARPARRGGARRPGCGRSWSCPCRPSATGPRSCRPWRPPRYERYSVSAAASAAAARGRGHGVQEVQRVAADRRSRRRRSAGSTRRGGR